MAAELASQTKRNRTRSPSYPYLDLPGALEKAAALWQAEGKHATSVSVAMQHWGYKEESSTGYSCVAALKKFGLVDHEGMGETRQMRLSELALRILLDGDPQSADRRAALREAALGPRVHAELWERYGHDLPSDQSLKRFLVLERSFNEASVDELLAEYRATMAYAGLSVRGTPTETSPPAARASAPVAATPAAAVQLAPAALPDDPGDLRPVLAANERPPRVLPPRAVGPSSPPPTASRPAPAAPQREFFDEDEEAAYRDDERYAGDALPAGRRAVNGLPARPTGPAAPETAENGGSWSLPRRELPVPLDNGLVASVPYPMTEEDFALLIDTLQLWKKRLVHPPAR